MRYFISQAMNGRTDAEIKEERHKVIAAMKKENPEAKVIDSFFEGAPNEARPHEGHNVLPHWKARTRLRELYKSVVFRLP